MNKDLYGKVYDIPHDTLEKLKKYETNETVRNLLSKKNLSYSLMKNIKHRMENGEKDVLGGDDMLGWINQTLNSDRSSIDLSKDSKMASGVSNSHIRPHTKNNLSNMNRQSKSHSGFVDDIKITENLKRINELISKII